MFVVTLSIGLILIEHVGGTSFNLAVDDGFPKFLSLDRFAPYVFTFIASVELFKFLTVDFIQSFGLIRTEKCPVSIFLYSFHEKIRDPESIEEITSSLLFLAVVLFKLKKVKNVCVPWLKIDGK